MSSPTAIASASEWANPEAGTSSPMPVIADLKSSRSSAVAIASALAPIISTPNLSSTPAEKSAIARLSAVWPPIVGRSASGRSRSMIASRTSGSNGSR